jgi:hypothetical protein
MRTDINRSHLLSAHAISKNHYAHMLIQITGLGYVDPVNIYTHTLSEFVGAES